ncbi:MAG TPA: glycosyltransferase family 39 protein [Polyangiaceae bacterium]|nr:glycosyltransferase family 39 protein [Polyangiaceae bacterium]
MSERRGWLGWLGARRAGLLDAGLFTGLFLGYLGALLATAGTLGYARDEGFYFHAAGTYGQWFELLFSNPAKAFQPAMVDRYWQENHEHPALMKSLFSLSRRLLEGRVFAERGTALRFPAMVLSALGVATTFAFGRRCVGRAAGVVAALCFALMPSIFYHSHLACFDMPITALWLFVIYAYYRSLSAGAWGWSLATGVLYGLALDTKHNAWLLPPALFAHALWLAVPRRFGGQGRMRVPWGLVSMVALGPPLLYALWPWIWRDTWARLVAYFQFHWQHVYYNMEYFGHTYFEPPFPRSYAWVMTLATVPGITLLLAGCGGAVAAGRVYGGWRAGRAQAVPAPAPGPDDAPPEPSSAPASSAPPKPPVEGAVSVADPTGTWASLWLLCILLSYAPWLSTGTPIFGGTKHWIPAYPFLGLFAGLGFDALARGLAGAGSARSGWRALASQAAPWALGFSTLIGPLVMTWHSHPWGLSAYTPLVGGAPGAATLGLNRTFWGYTTGAVTGYLNANMGRGEQLFIHDTAYDSLRMLQKDGRLRSDIKPWTSVSGSKFALYHHEQHMSRVEHMIWVDYGTTTPAHVATFDGVPIIWVYARPGAGLQPAK